MMVLDCIQHETAYGLEYGVVGSEMCIRGGRVITVDKRVISV